MSISNCSFCGKDTPNKSQICKECTGGNSHAQEHASSAMRCFDEWEGECEYDYSEDSLGPKQYEDRMGAKWNANDSEWIEATYKCKRKDQQ